MPYEYFLKLINDTQTFAPEILDEMHKYLESIPSYRWEDGSYIIFGIEEDKSRRVPEILVSRGRQEARGKRQKAKKVKEYRDLRLTAKCVINFF